MTHTTTLSMDARDISMFLACSSTLTIVDYLLERCIELVLTRR